MNGANNDDGGGGGGGKTLGPPLLFPSLFFLRATTQRSRGYWTRKVVRVEGEKKRTAEVEFESDRKRGSHVYCSCTTILSFLFFPLIFVFGRYSLTPKKNSSLNSSTCKETKIIRLLSRATINR